LDLSPFKIICSTADALVAYSIIAVFGAGSD